MAEDAYDKILKIVLGAEGKGGIVYHNIHLTPDTVDHPLVVTYHHNKWLKHIYPEFTDQHVPTKVVKMRLSEATRLQAIEDMKRLQIIQKRVDAIFQDHQSSGQAYSPVRLEFDQAVLFVPACLEFMNDNRDIVRNHFPQMHTCQCNAFSVPANSKPFGFHHASALGFESFELYERGWSYPEYHMSFHTAMNPTNENTSPLVVFDENIPTVFDVGFLLTKFLEEKHWRPDLTRLARVALICTTKKLVPNRHFFALYHFGWAVYYAMQSCQDESKNSFGTFWELEPGEALNFNNWRMHSDHGFGRSDNERHTLDLRCASKVNTPFPFTDERDLLTAILPTFASLQDVATDCLLRLFDYRSESDFYNFIGMPQKVRLSYALGNVLIDYMNAGDESLISERMLEGMRLHAKRARDMLDQNSLNYTAMSECVAENKETIYAASTLQMKTRNRLEGLSYWSMVRIAILGARLKLGYWGEKVALILAIALLRALWYGMLAVRAAIHRHRIHKKQV